ncbi:MAG: CHAT domain-containing protein, partial [Candidatus Zixiibacteriota bacterium]
NLRHGKINKKHKGIPDTLLEQRNSLRSTLKKIYSSNNGGQNHRLVKSGAIAEEQMLWSIERKIRNMSDRSINNNIVPQLETIDKFISENEILLNYVALGNNLGIFVISQYTQDYIEIPVSLNILRSDLRKLSFISENAVLGFKNNEKSQSDINHILTKIYQYIIGPVEDIIRDKNIILLANGDFFQIPFLALRNDNKKYLKDSNRINIICDPLDLAYRGRKYRNIKESRSAIFAAGLDSIPAIKIETEQIEKLYSRSNLYSMESANRLNLVKEMQKADGFLHIAAHAAHSSENPIFSKIILDDGPVYPFDIYGINNKPTLVTLSGCQTAAPGLYFGNSFSLAKAYYQAGTRFVIGSLWPISDKLSSYFMIHFYRELKKNNDVYLSYYKAVNIMAETIDNPTFWSSFILLGI